MLHLVLQGPANTCQMASPLPFTPTVPAIDRRGLFRLTAMGCVLALAPSHALAATRRTDPVVGFHADTPWLDPTGTDTPFVPPRGTSAHAPDDESLARMGHFL